MKIEEEFKDLIIPLKKDEFKRLEESIKEEGCREPLITWNGILLDGHHRYKICKKNNVDFNIIEKDFDSKNEAKLWMINNQLGRRNLTTFQKTKLALQEKELYEKEAKKNMSEGGKGLSKSTNLNTRNKK